MNGQSKLNLTKGVLFVLRGTKGTDKPAARRPAFAKASTFAMPTVDKTAARRVPLP